MSLVLSIAGVLGALTAGAISPGPSFIFVARTSVASTRKAGVAAAFGMGIGGLVFATLALLGFAHVMDGATWYALALRGAGGAYLLFLGVGLWRDARRPLVMQTSTADAPRITPWRSFGVGLFTQLSNPKAVVLYGGIFTALLPPGISVGVAVFIMAAVFVIETGWYALVAFVLSAPSARGTYLKAKTLIDRCAGGALFLLGIKLLLSLRAAG